MSTYAQEYVTGEMGKGVAEIERFPTVYSYSLGYVRSRHELLKALLDVGVPLLLRIACVGLLFHL